MSQAIICTICGKKYPFKPELAGKKVKCRCGHVISVPAPAMRADEDSLYQLAPDPTKDAVRGTVLPREGEEDDHSVACPSCGSAVAAGSVICMACGFNLKTGEKLEGIGSPVVPGPSTRSSSVPRFAGIPPGLSGKRMADEPKSAMFWKFGILIGVALLIVGAVVAMRFVGRGPNAGKPALDVDDESVTEGLSGFHEEARTWLTKNEMRIFSGLNGRQATAKIDEWYRLGAKNVWCFDPRMALWVGIELPGEPEKRAAIFDWQKKWHAEMFERVRTDKGQKYLVIKLPL